MSEGREIIDCSRGLCTVRRLLQNQAHLRLKGERVSSVDAYEIYKSNAHILFNVIRLKMESDPFTVIDFIKGLPFSNSWTLENHSK